MAEARWISTKSANQIWLTSFRNKNKTKSEIEILKVMKWYNNLGVPTELTTLKGKKKLKKLEGKWICWKPKETPSCIQSQNNSAYKSVKPIIAMNIVSKIGAFKSMEEMFCYHIKAIERK